MVVRAILRILQAIFAIIVMILYGIDLRHATNIHARPNSQWIFAQVAAALSLITCIAHLFITVTRRGWFVWDWVVAILWAALFGVFGSIYIGNKMPSGETGFVTSRERMIAGAYIDMINMLLWLGTSVHGIVWCVSVRRASRNQATALHRMDVRERGERFENI